MTYIKTAFVFGRQNGDEEMKIVSSSDHKDAIEAYDDGLKVFVAKFGDEECVDEAVRMLLQNGFYSNRKRKK